MNTKTNQLKSMNNSSDGQRNANETCKKMIKYKEYKAQEFAQKYKYYVKNNYHISVSEYINLQIDSDPYFFRFLYDNLEPGIADPHPDETESFIDCIQSLIEEDILVVDKSYYEVYKYIGGYYGICKKGKTGDECVFGGDSACEDFYDKSLVEDFYDRWDGTLYYQGSRFMEWGIQE